MAAGIEGTADMWSMKLPDLRSDTPTALLGCARIGMETGESDGGVPTQPTPRVIQFTTYDVGPNRILTVSAQTEIADERAEGASQGVV